VQRQHEVTRLEGFSDAVFGFALTLLVVSLEVPGNIDELMNLMRGLVPFALTFAMICWIWFEHQQFFRRYGLQDATTIAINCLLLFVVLFYVYPLKYVTTGLLGPWLGMINTPPMGAKAGAGADKVMLMYSSGVVMIFGAFTALYSHAWRQRTAIGLTPDEEITLRFGQRGHIISMLLGVVSIVLVGIGWATDEGLLFFFAGILYALMGPLHGWNGYQAGKAHARIRKQAAKA
jgi:uncharacterized membrane protein